MKNAAEAITKAAGFGQILQDKMKIAGYLHDLGKCVVVYNFFEKNVQVAKVNNDESLPRESAARPHDAGLRAAIHRADVPGRPDGQHAEPLLQRCGWCFRPAWHPALRRGR